MTNPIGWGQRFSEFAEETPKSWVQGLYELSTTAKEKLGVKRRLADGREFVYVLVGTTNIGPGLLVASPEGDLANICNLTITANANVGDDRQISFTLGNTGKMATANAFAEGWAWVNYGAGNGSIYKIKSHAAILANANGTVILYDKIKANIAASSSKLSLNPHKCSQVIVANATLISSLVGATVQAMTANNYGWIQTKGECGILANGSLMAGNLAVLGGVNGSANAAGGDLQYPIGQVIANESTGNMALIDLNL